MRLTTKEIFAALICELRKAVPAAECYRGHLAEGFTAPAFLLIKSFANAERTNLHTEERTLQMQIIYFGQEDGYGREDLDERLLAEEKILSFLSTHRLTAGERTLSFRYEEGEADEHLSFYLSFHFLDEAEDPSFTAAQAAETAETVTENFKAIGK